MLKTFHKRRDFNPIHCKFSRMRLASVYSGWDLGQSDRVGNVNKIRTSVASDLASQCRGSGLAVDCADFIDGIPLSMVTGAAVAMVWGIDWQPTNPRGGIVFWAWPSAARLGNPTQ